MNKKFQKRIFIYLVFFIVGLSFFNPNDLTFFQKNIAGFTLVFLVTYGITKKVKDALRISFCATLVLALVHYLFCKRNLEYFKDVEKDTEDIKVNKNTKNVALENITKDFNGIDENLDLDKLLKKDNKNIEKENKKVSKTKTLDELQELLDKAKHEGDLRVGKKLSDYTPAEAQRATFRLIDTTQQLKDTVEEMTPAIKNGMQLLQMMKKFK